MGEILETVWSGTLEREGKAPGLSTYNGRSSMHHSAAWEYLERLEAGECARVAPRGMRHKRTDAIVESQILQRLKFGYSYRRIADELGILVTRCRAVGRRHGIDRSAYTGTNQWTKAVA